MAGPCRTAVNFLREATAANFVMFTDGEQDAAQADKNGDGTNTPAMELGSDVQSVHGLRSADLVLSKPNVLVKVSR